MYLRLVNIELMASQVVMTWPSEANTLADAILTTVMWYDA